MFEELREAIRRIDELPPFPEYFQRYVMHVQDEQIAAEISYMMRHNVMDTVMLEKLMNESTKELTGI